MAIGTTALLTAEEFYDFVHRPENRDRHFELEEGGIVEMPPPGEMHCGVCANVTGLLFMYCRERKKGHVCSNDMGLVLEKDPDTVKGPDIVLYTVAKKSEHWNLKYPDRLPTLVVEVLSPYNRVNPMIRRLNLFLDKGVEVVWLVDPEARSVSVWWQGQAPVLFEEPAEIANLPGLPDFRCKVSEIFDAPGT